MVDLLRQLQPAKALGAEILVHMHREGDSPEVDYPNAIAWALRSDRPWILSMEDDIWLSPGFEDSAIEALTHADRSPAGAITLFTRHKEDPAMLAEGRRYGWRAAASHLMNQAIAMRRSVLEGFPDWAPTWYLKNPGHVLAQDMMLAGWLSLRKVKLMKHVPSLVQHRLGRTTAVRSRAQNRRSETYRLAFGDSP